jgi:hypothetical protein
MIHSYRSIRNMLYKPEVVLPFIMLLNIFINPFNIQSLQGQQSSKPAESKAPVKLGEEQWKAVEGIFQSSDNKEMYVQFTQNENVLLAKLLWNNNEIHLTPESELTFVSKEAEEGRPIHITFSKDATGTVNQVNVANNGVWNRTRDYKPVVKKEMAHTPDQLQPFEGLYQLQNDKERFIQFSVKGNNLVLKQHWDGNEISFVPETTLDFFSREVPLFSLTFTKAPDGSITQVLAFKRDMWDKVKKVHPATQELKAIEGKYQFKDDPDNYIQITAIDNHLVVKQLWDSKEMIVEPQTETYFYNNTQSYPLQVIKGNDGVVTQVLILGMDLFNKVN